MHSDKAKQRTRGVGLLTALVVFALASGQAAAGGQSFTDVIGGPGGGKFERICAPGYWMVGLGGRIGRWFDQVYPVCAPWDPVQRSFRWPMTVNLEPAGTSRGGEPDQAPCNMAEAVVELAITPLRTNEKFVDAVRVYCASILEPQIKRLTRELGTVEPPIAPPDFISCPAGQVATGIYGWSGTFVDRLGLVCNDAPAVTALPSPQPPVVVPPLGKRGGTKLDRQGGWTHAQIVGGMGGGHFEDVCPTNTHLVGMYLGYGAWIDMVQPICGTWDANARRFVSWTKLSPHGGGGGGPGKLQCRDDEVATKLAFEITGTNVYVRTMGIECTQVVSGNATTFVQLGNFADGKPRASVLNARPPGLDYGSNCSPGLVAVGLQGRSGSYLDAVGLLCAAPPRATPSQTPSPQTPSPTPGGGTEAYPDLPNAGPPQAIRLGKKIFNYRYPHIQDLNGKYLLLDWCRTWATNCGKAAADEFCRQQHGPKFRAIDFGEAKRIGARRPTLTIVSDEVCSQPNCSGFQYITCKKK